MKRKLYQMQKARVSDLDSERHGDVGRVLSVRRGIAEIEFNDGREIFPVAMLVHQDTNQWSVPGQLNLFRSQ